MKKYLALLLIAVTGVAFANVEKVPSSAEQGVEAIEPAFHNMPKDEGKLPLSYVNQPPMIPHSIKGYQVTKNTNQCLNCHGVENYRTQVHPALAQHTLWIVTAM